MSGPTYELRVINSYPCSAFLLLTSLFVISWTAVWKRGEVVWDGKIKLRFNGTTLAGLYLASIGLLTLLYAGNEIPRWRGMEHVNIVLTPEPFYGLAVMSVVVILLGLAIFSYGQRSGLASWFNLPDPASLTEAPETSPRFYIERKAVVSSFAGVAGAATLAVWLGLTGGFSCGLAVAFLFVTALTVSGVYTVLSGLNTAGLFVRNQLDASAELDDLLGYELRVLAGGLLVTLGVVGLPVSVGIYLLVISPSLADPLDPQMPLTLFYAAVATVPFALAAWGFRTGFEAVDGFYES